MIRAAQNATKTIPIVMAGAPPDPVNAGLVESLARPGGNVTGITILSRDLSGKRLELFKEAVPKIARVAVLYAPASAGAAREVKEVLPAAARALSVTVRSWEIRAAADFEKVFAELNKQPTDGLYLSPDVLLRVNQKRTIDFALKSRLPSMYSNREERRCRRAYVLRSGLRGQLPPRCDLRGQDPQGNKTRRLTGRAANEIRVHHQSENRQADRCDDSAECAGAGGPGDSVKALSGEK
jgi:putative ABC transport system substrate-binding protein